MTFDLRPVNWSEYADALTALRTAVFIEEQGVSLELEIDGLDEVVGTRHFVATLENEVIATGRLLQDGQIGRICVAKQYRRRGYGKRLLMHILQAALESAGFAPLWLNAQVSALELYRQCGFSEDGGRFMEAGIEHQAMRFDYRSASTLAQVFDKSVIRLNTPDVFAHHIQQMICAGKRSLHILSQELPPEIFHQGVSEAISQLARAHRQSYVQILVLNTQPLASGTHPLVTLARRLPSSIAIQRLHEAPKNSAAGYAIVDAKSLVYFNNEKEHDGFANYCAGSESKNALEEFSHLWLQHSSPDPNLQSFVI